MTRVDNDGDLILAIGPDRHRHQFRVCSRSLSRASPVFKAMLYGCFGEANRPPQQESWVVLLPEDDPKAAELMLSIVHSRFENLPANLAMTWLRDILVFSDKYDMTKAIRPWAQTWFPPRYLLQESPDYITAINIAWELGAEAVLANVVQRLIAECAVDADGDLHDIGAVPIEQADIMPLVPQGLFGKSIPSYLI